MDTKSWIVVHENRLPWTFTEMNEFIRDQYREVLDMNDRLNESFVNGITFEKLALTRDNELIIIDNHWRAYQGTDDMIILEESQKK